MSVHPQRGDIWLADLNPTRGHEQAGRRPVLVLSVDLFNAGPSDLVVILPLTSTIREIPFHVVIPGGEGGVRNKSAILCEAIRSISRERFLTKWGEVSEETMTKVEDRVKILLGL